MQLQSFAAGKWQRGTRDGVALRDATTVVVIANSSARWTRLCCDLEPCEACRWSKLTRIDVPRARGPSQIAGKVSR